MFGPHNTILLQVKKIPIAAANFLGPMDTKCQSSSDHHGKVQIRKLDMSTDAPSQEWAKLLNLIFDPEPPLTCRAIYVKVLHHYTK